MLETFKQYQIVEWLTNETRYKCMDGLDFKKDEAVRIYLFEMDSQQDREIVWNDFHLTINNLQKVADHLVLEAGFDEEQQLFFIICMRRKDAKPFNKYIEEQQLTQQPLKAVNSWIKIMRKVANFHAVGVIHGNLQKSFIEIDDTNGHFEVIVYDALLWHFRQIFLLDLETNDIYLPANAKNRNYRYEVDDYHFLGVLLFQLVFGGHPVPQREEQLAALESVDSNIRTILYYLLFSTETFTLSFIHELAMKYLEIQFGQYKLAIQWHPKWSQLFIEDEKNLEEWEDLFLQDTKDECYLFTTYRSAERRMILHTIGDSFGWEMQVVTKKDEILADAVLVGYKELAFTEREQMKEKGKQYRGSWQFKAAYQKQNELFLNIVRQESIHLQQQKTEKRKSREVFEQWERILTLQQQSLETDDKRFFYTEVMHQSDYVLRLKLYETHSSYQMEVGKDLAVVIDKVELVIGTLLEQGTNYLDVAISPSVDVNSIPAAGDIYEYMKRESILIRRQQKVISEFKYGKNIDAELKTALIDPSKNQSKSVMVGKYYQSLNSDQQQALEFALGADPMYLVQGPPGTGKTTWITELLLQIYRREPHARILITSQSNVAIDHAFYKSLETLEKYKDEFKKLPIPIRIGSDEKIAPSVKKWQFDDALNKWVEELEENIHENIWNLLERTNMDHQKHTQIMELFEEWKNTLRKSDEMKPLFLKQKPLLVGATCMGSYAFHLWNQTFDWIIIDEAAKSTAPEILVPLSLGKKVIFVGDHKQLSPIVALKDDILLKKDRATLQKELERSLFEDLFEEMEHTRSTLQTQYRMHPVIASLVSRLFYPNTPLVTGRKQYEAEQLKDEMPISWLAIDEHEHEHEIQAGTSYWNRAEVMLIQHHLLRLNARCEQDGIIAKSVSIITGYTAQREKLREAIHAIQVQCLQIEVDTVDAFQGREADVVYYSLVRHNSSRKLGFLSDERRTNVMLSRAKDHLYIVGHISQMKQIEQAHILRKLLDVLYEQESFTILHWKEVMS